MSVVKMLLVLVPPVALIGVAILVVVESTSAGSSSDEASRSDGEGQSSRSRGKAGVDRSHRPRGARGVSRRASSRDGLLEDVSPVSDEPEMSELPDAEPDPEARRAQVLAMWQGLLGEHREESRDHRWAASVEPRFETELRMIGESKELGRGAFEVSGIDCRNETCVASIDFGSFEDARQSVDELLQHHYEVNCGTTTVMPEPEDMSRPYSAELFFDCSSARSR